MSDTRHIFRGSKPRYCWLSIFLLLACNVMAQSPHDWLERMDGANEKFNYQGTLVHMCDGTMDIVRIVHRVDHGQVTERMTAQASGGRQIIRSTDKVMCILPDQKKVTVEQRNSSGSPMDSKIANFPSFSNINAQLYDISILGEDQIAERETIILAIHPADSFRFGYRLWLDHRTALPLKFELVDEAGRGLEQGVFTEIEFYESIPAEDVEPTLATDGFEWKRSAVVAIETQDDATADKPPGSGWRVEILPPGFKLTFAQSRLDTVATTTLDQLVYSDGLATISVFIEPEMAESAAVEGASKIGATNAFTTFRNGYLITAMGGVPLETARKAALSVSPR
ncbi:MAG: MucB/RseB C-terminal domain-containing protein [Gammaproteobacteria bacterium]|nr:MucB/RseB C-terminal domain-containing protein [Gammaproteobacteria bacterium]